MKEMTCGGWKFFVGNDSDFVKEKVGKWMYFFKDQEERRFIEERCRETVDQGIVWEAKCSDDSEGVACFYLNIDDIERHKQILQYFIDHNMIKRTKNGKLYNLSFKLDDQTRAGAYGKSFKAELKLEDLMDLTTEEWRV